MPKGLWERLRGARGFEALLAFALLALILLILMKPGVGASTGKTELEQRLERILTDAGDAGRVRVMVSQGEDGKVTGAVVVADRLDDAATYLNLQSAVTTLLEVDADRVEIIGKSGCFGGWQ